jgi:hypothetical protein
MILFRSWDFHMGHCITRRITRIGLSIRQYNQEAFFL